MKKVQLCFWRILKIPLLSWDGKKKVQVCFWRSLLKIPRWVEVVGKRLIEKCIFAANFSCKMAEKVCPLRCFLSGKTPSLNQKSFFLKNWKTPLPLKLGVVKKVVYRPLKKSCFFADARAKLVEFSGFQMFDSYRVKNMNQKGRML